MQRFYRSSVLVRPFTALSIILIAAQATAQQSSNYYPNPRASSSTERSYSGWVRSSSNNSQPVSTARSAANQQISKYQQMGDYPAFNGGGEVLPAGGPTTADDLVGSLNDLRPVQPQPLMESNVPPSLPNMPSSTPPRVPQLQNANNQQFPSQQFEGFDDRINTGDPRRTPAALASYQNGGNSVLPPSPNQNYPAQGYPSQDFPTQNGNYQNLQNSTQVLPGQGYSGPSNGRQVYPGQANPGQVYPGQAYQGQNPMQGQPGSMYANQGGNTQLRTAPGVTTGLPYVSAAPNQRYATSPYLGPRNVPIYYTSYQRPATGAVLPQNIPTPTGPIYNTTGAGVYPTNYAQQCDPATGYIPPTYTPNLNPSMYSANNSGYRPLFSLGQENYNVQLGRGLYGQPTVYVPGQYIRNFFRYIFP